MITNMFLFIKNKIDVFKIKSKPFEILKFQCTTCLYYLFIKTKCKNLELLDIFFLTVVVFSHRRNHSRFLAYWYVCYVNKAFIYT